MSQGAVARKDRGLVEPPTCMTELRKECSVLFADGVNGDKDSEALKQIANVAGKIIKSLAVQNEYYALRRGNLDRPDVPEIPYAK